MAKRQQALFTAQVPSHSASASLSAKGADGAAVAADAVPGRGSGSFSSCLGKALGRKESLPTLGLGWAWKHRENMWDTLEKPEVLKK